jgi:hypothetical protein
VLLAYQLGRGGGGDGDAPKFRKRLSPTIWRSASKGQGAFRSNAFHHMVLTW